MSDPAEEPKLIIDEDWKTQVQREKEELKQKTQAEAAQEKAPTAAPTTAAEQQTAASNQHQPEPPPPASLTLLVTTLATQAMAAMGLMPSEEDDQPPAVNLEFAKHFVDMLAVLEEKTRGNLSEAEKNFLNDALHQLRLTFVAVSKQQRT